MYEKLEEALGKEVWELVRDFCDWAGLRPLEFVREAVLREIAGMSEELGSLAPNALEFYRDAEKLLP